MYWLYELPSRGKIESHDYGSREVVMSNHMDVINVMSITGPATVKRWGESDDKDVGEAFYYRQTFNCRSLVLSPVDG
jgi:hypothetical protein